MIPFKMMYNMSMLRHPFSNEQWGGGGGGLNHLPLLFCKSVYFVAYDATPHGFMKRSKCGLRHLRCMGFKFC